MKPQGSRLLTILLAGLAGGATLVACGNGDDSTTTVAPPPDTTVTTVTDLTTEPPVTTTTTETTATTETTQADVSIPGGAFTGIIAGVSEIDPAPFASSEIFPSQPGLQFVGPDGTFCEMYGMAEDQVPAAQAMCTHDGEGDVNAVVLNQGQPAVEMNVNRIFIPHEKTRTLQPGQRISIGPVSCAVAEGETRVMCAVPPYSFAVSTDGLDLG